MPGGISYKCGTLIVGGTQIYDLSTFSTSLSADNVFLMADCRKYPQQGGTTNHRAIIEATTFDLSEAAQSSSGTPLIGSSAGSVVLTIDKNGTGSMIYTVNPAVWTKADVSGGHGDLATLDIGFEAAGTSGNEPTVTWAVGA